MCKDSDLIRFVDAKTLVIPTVLQKLKQGRIQSHWMWFIFPQLKELGFSSRAKFYGISGIVEAQAYLENPILRQRLEECLTAVLNCNAKNPIEILVSPTT